MDDVRAAVAPSDRIGHGIRVPEDPDLVAELRRRRVPLEVCPSSDVLLGLVPSWAATPARASVEGSFAPAGWKARISAEIGQWLSG
ncbi:hypothetical protein ACWG5P_11585 [Streptomyces prasinus]|uniref:hypothetical protein n=1 Tax=Streptomyces prasinus TaxID=67345 RepID=UPI0033B21AFB